MATRIPMIQNRPFELASGSPYEDPIDGNTDWFDSCLTGTCEKVRLLVTEANQLSTYSVHCGIAKRLLFCRLGDFVLAKFPIRVASLALHDSQIRDDKSVYDRLFAQVLTRSFDAIHLKSVRPGTTLWRYLQRSPLLQNSFRFYSQRGPRPHWLIRLNGSFNDFTKQLSAKTRKNRIREVKLLRKIGEVELVRITKSSEIDGFLDAAYTISRKTRKFQQFGWSVAARDRRLLKNELVRLARQGCLRSYLLTCGKAPCSFILGQQSDSRFYPVAAGADPGWKHYSTGTALLWLALEDLFAENSPVFYDLGTSAKQKQYLATDSYLDAEVWLFRRGAYPALARSICRACDFTSRIGGAALERLGLKRQVLQFLYAASNRPAIQRS